MQHAKDLAEQLQRAARAATTRQRDETTRSGEPLRLVLESGEPVEIPDAALRALIEVLQQIADGNDVAVLPVHSELTTQQAADLLNVSRPHVIKLIESGKLPHRRVGTHRRLRLSDVLTYKRIDDARRAEAADALAAEAQALDLGY